MASGSTSTMPHEMFLRQIERFAAEVLPALHRQGRPEMSPGERIGQLALDLEVVQALGVREQVESEHAHGVSLHRRGDACLPRL